MKPHVSKHIDEIKVIPPGTYFITPEAKEWLELDSYALEELFSEDIVDALHLFNWISNNKKTISKYEIENWFENNPDVWGGDANSMIDFLLDQNVISNEPLNEIKVEKSNPISSSVGSIIVKNINSFIDKKYDEFILEFDEFFKGKTIDLLINSDDFEINDLVANFVKDQMVFNNHHLVRGNNEILLNFSNLNIVTKQDILNYVKEHPKLDEFIYSLIKEQYIENQLDPYFNKLKSELRTALLKLSHGGNLEDWNERDFTRYLDREFDSYEIDPSYPDEYLNADELRYKLLRADLIKEHKTNNIYTHKHNKMNPNKLRRIIRESVNDFIREIDEAGDTAAMDAKIAKCEEAIALREKKIEMSESLEEMKDLVDSTKINELKKEIKDLQKAKAKFEKAKEKKANKGKKKEVVTDGENPEENVEMEAKITDEALGEAPLNEAFIRMQKLAGLITEDFSMVNEDKIPFFHLKQILTPFGIDTPKADQMTDLKLGLKVLPKKSYRDQNDIKSSIGKIVKIEGDKVTIEKINGQEENYKKSDLIHYIDGGYNF